MEASRMADERPPTVTGGSVALTRWWRMTLKELREILRDRRTIITLVGMPLLIYPLLGVTFQKLLVTQAANTAKIEYRIVFASQRDSRIFRRLFKQGASFEFQKAENSDEQ